MLGLGFLSRGDLGASSSFQRGGGRLAIASVGNGLRPHPRLRSQAFEILTSGDDQRFTVDPPEPT
jgi:hypothetical protein